ncbi:hypothetical protein V6N13_119292 [Hibiscus sabdariffa]
MQALPSPATYNAHHERVLSAKFFCPIRKKPFHGGFVASGQSQSLLKTARLQKRKITYVRTEKEFFPSFHIFLFFPHRSFPRSGNPETIGNYDAPSSP